MFLGKNLLKASILSDNESGSNAILNYANQAVLTRQVQSACQVAAAIDSVSTSDVQNVSQFLFLNIELTVITLL